jgi:hypothetical protein
MRSSQAASMTWIRPAPLCPKNRSRSACVVADTGQMHPRGQSRGNQNIGACRVSTAHTSGRLPGLAAGMRGTNLFSEGSSLKCHNANDGSPAYGGAASRASRCSGYSLSTGQRLDFHP